MASTWNSTTTTTIADGLKELGLYVKWFKTNPIPARITTNNLTSNTNRRYYAIGLYITIAK